MNIQTYTVIWNEIEILAKYEPLAWGGATAQLTIQSVNPKNAPLPVSETGFRSHYHPVGTIEKNYNGDVIASIMDWLNEAAKDKKWLAYVEKSKQGDLFS